MELDNILIHGKNAVELYKKDCLFDKRCELAIVKKEDSNGKPYLVTQCVKCGYGKGGFISKKFVEEVSNVSPFNKELNETVYKRKFELLYGSYDNEILIRQKLSEISKEIKSQFFKDSFNIDTSDFLERYQIYMQSEKWYDKRKKILDRDNHLCRYCQTNKAQQVHHLAYQNLGNESDFELISVCIPCHEIIHSTRENAHLFFQENEFVENNGEMLPKKVTNLEQSQTKTTFRPADEKSQLRPYKSIEVKNAFLNGVELLLKQSNRDIETSFTVYNSSPTLVIRNISNPNIEVLASKKQIKFVFHYIPFSEMSVFRNLIKDKVSLEIKDDKYNWHHDGMVVYITTNDFNMRLLRYVYIIYRIASILKDS